MQLTFAFNVFLYILFGSNGISRFNIILDELLTNTENYWNFHPKVVFNFTEFLMDFNINCSQFPRVFSQKPSVWRLYTNFTFGEKFAKHDAPRKGGEMKLEIPIRLRIEKSGIEQKNQTGACCSLFTGFSNQPQFSLAQLQKYILFEKWGIPDGDVRVRGRPVMGTWT